MLVTAPAVITIYFLFLLVTTLDGWLVSVIPSRFRPEYVWGIYIPGIGLLAGLIVVVTAGALTRNYFGRKLVRYGEEVMQSIPGVRSVYGAVKQIVETVGATNSRAFREVVMIEYPRKGIWCLGFLTGITKGEVQHVTTKPVLNVFLPTTPNPTSGFLLFVPEEDVIRLNMSVEEGLKMVISGGIVTPTLTAKAKRKLADQQAGE